MSLKNILKLSWLFGLLIVQCQSTSTQVPPFRELARMFDYDQSAPLDVKEHSVEEREGAKVYAITYASPQGGRVTAYLVAPAGKGRHAGIIFAHPGGGDRKVFLPEALTSDMPLRQRCYSSSGVATGIGRRNSPWSFTRPAATRRRSNGGRAGTN